MKIKLAGSFQRQSALLQRVDISSNVKSIGITGSVQITDGAATQTGVFVVINNVFINQSFFVGKAPGRRKIIILFQTPHYQFI